MTLRTARILVVVAVVAALAALVLTLAAPTAPPRADLTAGPPAGGATPSSTTAPAGTPITVGTPATPVAETSPPPAPAGTDPAEPSRIRIPAIGVDAPVVAVGLEPDGSMEVPGADQAGWYHPTEVRPGAAAGSAVVAAHVDFGGRRGVFFDLRQVPVGAEVVVVDQRGTERRFVVDTRFQVDKDELPAEELFRTGGPPTLTLITCGGAFDRSIRHYRDNIILRARPA
jgi:hypothetical protein